MATLYRAIWSDAGPQLIEIAREMFCSWARDKSDNRLVAEEPGNEETDDGAVKFQLREARSEDQKAPVTEALQVSLVEIREDGSRWTTTLRAWMNPHHPGSGWMWVDVEAVTHDSFDRVVVAAPRFVPDLLAQGSQPNRRGIPVSALRRDYAGKDGAEQVAELLTHVDRDLPIVVFSPLPSWYDSHWLPSGRSVDELHQQAITRAAKMSAGMALVCYLDNEGIVALGEALGESYSVRDGAFRIYLPGLDPAIEDEWRHRYTVLSQFIKRPDAAGKLINRAIALPASARRAPDSYEFALRLLESALRAESDDSGELLEVAEEEINQLRERIASRDQIYLNVLDDKQQLEEENNKLRQRLYVAREKLALVESGLWQDQPEEMARVEALRIPATADYPSEAARLTQVHLSDFLSFPGDAHVDLTDIDNCVEANAWGDSSWRAFRALHAYAKDMSEGQDVGTFWTWCERSHHALAWPATTKKLAMTESESVKNSKVLKARRTFPVDRHISDTGKVFMEAHIKIAEGGGPLAPRIYFLPSRKTGQVHIGYFGPHRNIPNTLT